MSDSEDESVLVRNCDKDERNSSVLFPLNKLEINKSEKKKEKKKNKFS